jgi:3-phosphoshikimate 1-carboxyvinyltransferase
MTPLDHQLQPQSSSPAGPLTGDIRVPGDKSISHRAVIVASLTVGRSVVRGLLEGDDVLRTVSAMQALGARIKRLDDESWIIDGVGLGGLSEPNDLLDFGNSGTGVRLLLGVLASQPIAAVVSGDASLRQRPMNRVIEPLSKIGARFVTRDGGRLPLSVCGTDEPMPITYRPPVASAQVKSAILLAGLNAPGVTTVIEAQATRDHTERILQHFGAEITVTEDSDGRAIALTGQPELRVAEVDVPGDFSSAAFPLVAALITPDSALTLRNIGINPHRTGLLTTLLEMGANIDLNNECMLAGEPVADIKVRASRLRGVEVGADRAPSMIDEYPVLAVAAAHAEGTSIMHGLAELRVKESDRLAAIVDGLQSCGLLADADGDKLTIQGWGQARGDNTPTGGHVRTHLDHRIAMSFLVLGITASAPVTVDDGEAIATSFPGFANLMNELGAKVSGGPAS